MLYTNTKCSHYSYYTHVHTHTHTHTHTHSQAWSHNIIENKKDQDGGYHIKKKTTLARAGLAGSPSHLPPTAHSVCIQAWPICHQKREIHYTTYTLVSAYTQVASWISYRAQRNWVRPTFTCRHALLTLIRLERLGMQKERWTCDTCGGHISGPASPISKASLATRQDVMGWWTFGGTNKV